MRNSTTPTTTTPVERANVTQKSDLPFIAMMVAVAGGAAVLGSTLLALDTSWNLTGLLLLAATGAGLERFSARLFSQTRVSVSATMMLAAGALYGVSAAIPVALAIALACWAFRRKPISRLLFNGGLMVFTGVAASAMYHGLLDVLGTGEAAIVVSAVAAGLAMWAIGSGLVSLMISATSDERAVTVFRENYLWLFGHFAVMGAAAIGLSLLIASHGWIGFAAFLAPMALFTVWLRLGAALLQRAMAEMRDTTKVLPDLAGTSDLRRAS
jgi:hypothetical protein